MVARPSSASARDRGRCARVDDGPAQPEAGRGREEHGGQLQHPVRQDEAEELSCLAVADHQAAVDPHVERVVQQDPQRRDAQQHPEDERLSGDQDVVAPHLEGERRRGVLGVVVAELVIDQAGHLGPGDQAGLDGRRPGDPPAGDEGDGQRDDRRAQPPPPGAVGHRREPGHGERANAAPGRHVGAADHGPGAGQPGRQLGRQRLVMPGAAQLRQLGGDPLVGADQLVDLGAGQLPPAPHQVVQAVPLSLVRGDERVYVHAQDTIAGGLRIRPGKGCRASTPLWCSSCIPTAHSQPAARRIAVYRPAFWRRTLTAGAAAARGRRPRRG